ncbi:hypothetical protein [Massilia phosphatilytica]
MSQFRFARLALLLGALGLQRRAGPDAQRVGAGQTRRQPSRSRTRSARNCTSCSTRPRSSR